MDVQNISVPESLDRFITDGTPDRIRARYAKLKEFAEAADFGVFDNNVVVIDTETTGVSFKQDELTQIAAARVEDGKVVDWFNTFVNPGKSIPEDVARLTNIHDEDVADAPTPDEALAELVAFVGDAKLVAHNAEFDKHFTTNHPSGYPLLENIWIDSLDLSRIALPRMKSHRLLDLVRAFGAPVPTHRADDDVAATCVVFRILLAAVASMPPDLLRQIALMATPIEWSTQVVFAHFAQQYAEKTDEEGNKKTIPFSLRYLRRHVADQGDRKAHIDAFCAKNQSEDALKYPTQEEIEKAFSDTGLLGAIYPGFEPRAEQLTMSKAVAGAYEADRNLVVEAGTGVGKSMAYLVPSALFALSNNVTVGVATKTNALLDQLVFHELPALSRALKQTYPDYPELTFAPLKGYSHYPCLRRVDHLVKQGPGTRLVQGKEVHQAPALAALLSFVDQTDYDDMDSLKMDYRALPRWNVTTTGHDCLGFKCPFFGEKCFVHGARRRAKYADIVVTNHSLLFWDMRTDNKLMPVVRHWVVDEAHGAESVARDVFSLSVTADGVLRLASRLEPGENLRNVFVRAERRVSFTQEESATLFFALSAKARAAGAAYCEAAREFAAHMKDLLFFVGSRKSKGYDITELWVNEDIRSSATFGEVARCGKELREKAELVVKEAQSIVALLEDVDGAGEPQREIASVALELKDQANALDVLFENPSPKYAYSATVSSKKDRTPEKMEALLLNVGEKMNDYLFASTSSVVFASATLSVNHSFVPFSDAMGLNATEQSACDFLELESSYDFDANMTVYVATDIPEPSDARYLKELQKLLSAAHVAQRGSMLTLFTNRREMEQCFDAINPVMKENDLRLVCQKWGVSVKALRDDFITDKHLSLFALKSFWEGFDAPGSTLRGVIIPKLPFGKPSDPLYCERNSRDDQAWKKFVLPAAVLETKQAAGRLIRKSDDRGVLILADSRLASKWYGRVFLGSMPSSNIKRLTVREIVEELELVGDASDPDGYSV